MMEERRRRRSEFRGNALDLWLRSVSSRCGLEGLVLSDDRGLLVASNLERNEAEEVAVAGRLLAAMQEKGARLSPRLPLAAAAQEYGEERLCLCALGERNRGQQGLAMAWPGVQRILDGV
jgi:hypothetical protein